MTWDSCNATRRERSKLHICELPMNHDGLHRDGSLQWASDTTASRPVIVESR